MNRKTKLATFATVLAMLSVGCSSINTLTSSTPSLESSPSSVSSVPSSTPETSSVLQQEALELQGENPDAVLAFVLPEDIQNEIETDSDFFDVLTVLSPYMSDELKNSNEYSSLEPLVSTIRFFKNDEHNVTFSYGKYETDVGNFWHGTYTYRSDGIYSIQFRESLGSENLENEYGPEFSATFLLQYDSALPMEDAFYLTILDFGSQPDNLCKELIGQKIFYKNLKYPSAPS